MKMLITILISCMVLFSLSACWSGQKIETQDSTEAANEETAGTQEQDLSFEQSRESEDNMDSHAGFTMSDYYLQITSEGHTAIFRLYDTTAAKELYDQLPLTLETTNFASAQWMFYPPEHLGVTEAEAYHDGKKGELSYYDPWGDVFMLYEDFHAGDEMHRLGICLEGIDELEGMSGTIQVLSEAQKFDLYLPEADAGPFLLVMFIHGGGWYSGDKADGQEERMGYVEGKRICCGEHQLPTEWRSAAPCRNHRL